MGKLLTFLGLQGSSPQPSNDMRLTITLPIEKRRNWAITIEMILEVGAVTRGQLESLIGRLSFPQTSIFGRFGRPMLSPLIIKLRTTNYHPLLSDRETRILQWWKVALTNPPPRTVRERSDRADAIIFTDAATKTGIIAALTFDRNQFLHGQTVFELRKMTTGAYWGTLFCQTNLIYGLEMLAVLAILYAKCDHVRNKNATLHIDNGNAFEALVKNNARPTAIVAMTHLIWHRIYELGITPWFEWVHGARNIAYFPTRNVKFPFKCTRVMDFPLLRDLRDIVNLATAALEKGRPIIAPMSLGGTYLNFQLQWHSATSISWHKLTR